MEIHIPITISWRLALWGPASIFACPIRSEEPMIRLSVFYPDTPGRRFDVDYYAGKHLSLVKSRCGSALKATQVEKGLGGYPAGEPAPYRAIGHLTFDSIEAMNDSFVRHLPEFVADLPNFTDLPPKVQISEVVD